MESASSRKKRTQTMITSRLEVADATRARRRRLAGEGMLVVRRSFTWRGEPYKAGVTRVTPDHPVCQSEHAGLLQPARKNEASPAVLRFMRRRAEGTRPAYRRADYWRLGPEAWRLSTRHGR